VAVSADHNIPKALPESLKLASMESIMAGFRAGTAGFLAVDGEQPIRLHYAPLR
jgi:hypothetical protein